MRQRRKDVRQLKAMARTGDLAALLLLLQHSVAYGHKRLSVRRYLMARARGAIELEDVKHFCQLAGRTMFLEDVLDAAHAAVRSASRPTGAYQLAAELIGNSSPLFLPYGGILPALKSELWASGKLTAVIGRASIGDRLTMGPRAVIRADGHFVRIGDDFSLGSQSTVHITHERQPAIIGDRVAVGDNACIHACTIGADCAIGNRVLVLDGAVVESGVVIDDEATVYPRAILKSGYLYAGSPATRIRKLDKGERAARVLQLAEQTARAILGPSPCHEIQRTTNIFVASTASLAGHIELNEQSSVFFSCVLDARRASIQIGRATNIQDNTLIECTRGKIIIGANTTIGHNVSIRDCQIGSRSLVGIGASLSPGTVVEDDVFVAAGTTTSPGQRLKSGSVWGGRPARQIAVLNESKTCMMRQIISQYCQYAEAFSCIESKVPSGNNEHGRSQQT